MMNSPTVVTKIETQEASPLASTPLAMIALAIDKGASVETLERLMALQERYEANVARREFDEAISAAKAEIKPIIKNRHTGYDSKTTNSRTEYDYEDLAQVAEAVDPILTNHGLSYRFASKQDGQTVSVTCIVSHKRGHREETTLQAGNDTTGSKNAIQAVGSAVTYLQRYTLKLALGLAATKDNDGQVPSDASKPVDEAQFRYIRDLIEKSNSEEPKVLKYVGADALENMTQSQYRKAEAGLRKRISDMEKK